MWVSGLGFHRLDLQSWMLSPGHGLHQLDLDYRVWIPGFWDSESRFGSLDLEFLIWISGCGAHCLNWISGFGPPDLDPRIWMVDSWSLILRSRFYNLDLRFCKAKGSLLNVRREAVVCFRATLHGPRLTSFIDPEWTNLEIKNQCPVPLQTVFFKHHIFL